MARASRELGPITDPGVALDDAVFSELSGEHRIGIITGVNGSGKTTTTRQLVGRTTGELSIIRRHTTKDLRPNDYIYNQVDEAEFETMLERDDFVEAALYGPGYYGTTSKETRVSLGRSTLAVCEMDPVASLVYKQRMRNISNVSVRLFFLNPFEGDSLTMEEKMVQIQARAGAGRMPDDPEERDRFIKSATFDYASEPFDRRISVASTTPEEAARIIYGDLVS